MPALNAAKTLRATVAAIPRDWVDEMILVDDRSTDETVKLAPRARRPRGLASAQRRLRRQPEDLLPGGAAARCGDRGHASSRRPVRARADPEADRPIRGGEADLVLGTRMAEPGAAREAGMPLYKRVANRSLTTIENRVMGTELTDLHTGYRAYGRELLLTVPFLRNSIDFVFDSELLMQASHFGFRIAEVPARTRYFADASSITLGATRLRREDAVVGGPAAVASRARAALAPIHPLMAAGTLSRGVGRARGAGPGTLLFFVALVVSAGALVLWLSDLTFWRDEWDFILDRRYCGIEVFLDPFVEQLLALPIAAYKLMVAVFGIESPLPFQLAQVALDRADHGPVLLPAPARRRVAGARGRDADPLLRPRLGRPAVPVPDQLPRGARLRRRGTVRARPRGSPRRPGRRGSAAHRALLPARRDRVRGRGDDRHRLHPRPLPAGVGGRDPDRVLVRLVLRLGSGGGELRLLPQLPDPDRLRRRRPLLQSLEPARAGDPPRRDGPQPARLGPAAAA